MIEYTKYRVPRQEIGRQVVETKGREKCERRKEMEDRGTRTVLEQTNDKDEESIMVKMKIFSLENWNIRKRSN